MNWYLEVLRKYTVFAGRAQRAEYWYFVLINLLINIGLSLLDDALGMKSPDFNLGLLGGIYSLAVLVPSLAVSVRRLHDTGRSGWWLLIGLVPVIGFIVLLVFMATDSHPGANTYGPNPKEGAVASLDAPPAA